MASAGTTGRATVIDASCLIHLWHLDLVRTLVLQYDLIYIPRFVKNECSRKGRRKNRLADLIADNHPLLQICDLESPHDSQLLYDSQRNPDATLDRGEAEVIIQARERGVSTVLIDDRKGKRLAEQHSLIAYDLLDILTLLKRDGILTDVRSYLDKLDRQKYRPSVTISRKVS